ncbi:MAG: hypothetical protein A2504_15570 [Bdellovibrionales bacterium RIFOXYD12_FULL_39_22]|nr:MAG: hypothetical protein A2385_03000 [Bdellovibrionales bacterium RIFOXYB1_FULL_39_21]OFZ43212.1 MAG: hypothetical protein A2485_12145 [Bdellovibrionales bacterium RIFOXYC12_FULL_39_17]OFZ47950.1 MAG: hypothetical protein A2404_16785 [Bdellovibrionales bacterium RIFOXYC1_FULL_39_130]OFZ73665.1 MAG: hypothetical protein A2451_14695 [Bdellovibrionales bacterium RIFOXYC2_FULL_39_8]OFZ75730.1 MAG: hypothetical protein A2560_13285 [Bdellovibrionales bacterium RIFOXYD1_FULL_39_84]OFZ94220.1 MAG:
MSKFRESSFFSISESICPVCRRILSGKILLKEGKVFLAKRCPEHGHFEALLSSDDKYWVNSLSYTKPGQLPLKFSKAFDKGCPEDCGLCEEHEQHTCSPIIEINNKCDLECPVCIVWNENNYEMSFEDFKKIVDGLIEKEGSLELVLLSGGEPTLHSQFEKFAQYITSKKEIKRVLISSHGLRIAKDEEFAKRFAQLGLYLSLQFDTLRGDVYEKLRGRDLLADKMKCLERCEKYKIPTVIVPTIARGYNEDEVGALANFAFKHDFITSVTFQPMAYTGKGGSSFSVDESLPITQADMHQLLATQTDWLKKEDFLPIPCSHPQCYSATYLLKVAEAEFIPLTRFGEINSYLDAMANRALLDSGGRTAEMLQDAVYSLWSAQSITVDSKKVNDSLKNIIKQNQASCCALDLQKYNEGKFKAIFIHSFMDENNFEVSRIRKCCTHYALPDGRLMPGCSYNNIHRHRDERLKRK